jgi:hypothetical protein
MIKKWIGLRMVSHKEWLALYWSFSSAVGVQFARSSSKWQIKARVLTEEIS